MGHCAFSGLHGAVKAFLWVPQGGSAALPLTGCVHVRFGRGARDLLPSNAKWSGSPDWRLAPGHLDKALSNVFLMTLRPGVAVLLSVSVRHHKQGLGNGCRRIPFTTAALPCISCFPQCVIAARERGQQVY
eukprot:CAMPEP_0174300816 /NCGR_PEP_ID=MMETSP0809-20121228/58683_1 /TAXON_ID=73025 ORGANISM="Eutreptiella gymnastica-like, Strain CCMP1594" /NCGR_SAMPLE_ID=MMETSP0809 /ASSEMBLY_ACC=CAM_ASM_000658 /LENGTH=130 /DNA_ID=CAMNT_0015406467 /DNA_START=1785 /DNA_END=2177 /DNA_ORIENTATION=-